MIDTKTKILDVAEDLIQHVGINAMSYKDISEAVGIRKASIHHHFPKKEDLVNAILERCLTLHSIMYQEIVQSDGTAPEKLRRIAAIYENGLKNDKICLLGSISNSCTTLQKTTSHFLEKNIQTTVSIFSTIFVQGQEEGSLRKENNALDAASAYFSFLLGTQTLSRSHGGEEGFHRATEVFISAISK